MRSGSVSGAGGRPRPGGVRHDRLRDFLAAARSARIRGRGVPLVMLLGLWASACGGPSTIRPLSQDDVPALQAATSSAHRLYRIEPGDLLEIDYPYHPEMKQQEPVRPDGRITTKLVGELLVAGMTPAELSDTLVQRTSDRLRNPEVTVRVQKVNSKEVYVGGEVGKQGPVPYRKGLSPIQAIIAAGGFRDTARTDSVVLIRANPTEQTITSRKLNLQEILATGTEEPLELGPNDVLFVPRSGIAEVDLWVRQHIVEVIPFFRMSMPLPVFP
jgi:protein involved in polysaccharide export with SLBB domain